ncbi:MAG: nucleotide exchange factor GrpE [Bacteroidota bacterium]
MIGKRKKDEPESSDNLIIEDELKSEEPASDIAQTANNGMAEQYAELNDKYLRLYSDFDNYRKRTLKEKIELSKTASVELILKLLPVLDDFERAIKAFKTTSDADEALKDGTILIFNKFFSILNQQGLEQMRTLGENFDTDFHEAITNIPAATPDQKGKIIDELEKGYLLHGKVIRYAKVVVGS